MTSQLVSPEKDRFVIGCMTGTSIDALDTVLVRIINHGTTEMRVELVRGLTEPLGDLVKPLRALAQQQPMTAGDIARLNRDFSLLHVKAIERLLSNGTTRDHADLVVVHGQTVFHEPPVSWQMINAPIMANALGCRVVSDLRAFDLAAGGEGAPITPLADYVLYREKRGKSAQVIVNLGGFCNITYLPRSGRIDEIQACDVCACNHVIDRVARLVLDKPFDHNGNAAMQGEFDRTKCDALVQALTNQHEPSGKRSLGTRDELDAMLRSWIADWNIGESDDQAKKNLARTACAAVASAIDSTVKELAGDSNEKPLIVLAGGGLRNHALRHELEERNSGMVVDSDLLGVPATYREAMGMAVLGALAQDGEAITLPQVTHSNRTEKSRWLRDGQWCG